MTASGMTASVVGAAVLESSASSASLAFQTVSTIVSSPSLGSLHSSGTPLVSTTTSGDWSRPSDTTLVNVQSSIALPSTVVQTLCSTVLPTPIVDGGIKPSVQSFLASTSSTFSDVSSSSASLVSDIFNKDGDVSGQTLKTTTTSVSFPRGTVTFGTNSKSTDIQLKATAVESFGKSFETNSGNLFGSTGATSVGTNGASTFGIANANSFGTMGANTFVTSGENTFGTSANTFGTGTNTIGIYSGDSFGAAVGNT